MPAAICRHTRPRGRAASGEERRRGNPRAASTCERARCGRRPRSRQWTARADPPLPRQEGGRVRGAAGPSVTAIAPAVNAMGSARTARPAGRDRITVYSFCSRRFGAQAPYRLDVLDHERFGDQARVQTDCRARRAHRQRPSVDDAETLRRSRQRDVEVVHAARGLVEQILRFDDDHRIELQALRALTVSTLTSSERRSASCAT